MITLLLNASGFRLAGCSQRIYNRMILGYHPKGSGNSALFGTAYHRYKALRAQGAKAGEARIEAERVFSETPCAIDYKKEWINLDYLRKTIAQDWMLSDEGVLPVDKISRFADDSLAVEHSFAIPYYRNDDVEVILCGTIDKLVDLPAGIIAIGDYKTTTAWERNDFFQKYRMSGQLMFYAFCIQYLTEQVPQAAKYKTFVVDRVATFIDAVFIKKDTIAEFQRSPILVWTREDLSKFKKTLDKIIGRIIDSALRGPENQLREGVLSGLCEGSYGKPCEYFSACAAKTDDLAQELLNRGFEQKPYNPINSQRV